MQFAPFERRSHCFGTRIIEPWQAAMLPIPGVPFSDFLEMFAITGEEISPEISSGRLAVTIRIGTWDDGDKFITPSHFHAWINHPQTPPLLRDRAMARVKPKMD